MRWSDDSSAIFLNQLFVFVVIIAGLLTLVVAETWFRQMVEVRMREWLTTISSTMASTKRVLLAFAGKVGVNPDQRMQADAHHLSELSAELSIGLAAVVPPGGLRRRALAAIGSVLFTVHDQSFTFPGYLIWCALAYAASGSWLTWRVGRPLVAINAERYA